MDNSWKLAEYTVSELQEAIETNKITIPKYQRGFVWGKDKQKSLIETIKKAILLDRYLFMRILRGNSNL